MNDNIVYCSEECSYTQCVRNKKKSGAGATFVSADQFIGCHVRNYTKDFELKNGFRYLILNDVMQRRHKQNV